MTHPTFTKVQSYPRKGEHFQTNVWQKTFSRSLLISQNSGMIMIFNTYQGIQAVQFFLHIPLFPYLYKSELSTCTAVWTGTFFLHLLGIMYTDFKNFFTSSYNISEKITDLMVFFQIKGAMKLNTVNSVIEAVYYIIFTLLERSCIWDLASFYKIKVWFSRFFLSSIWDSLFFDTVFHYIEQIFEN